MIKKQSRRTYPKAFREEAVALVTEQGYSVANAACIRNTPLLRKPVSRIFAEAAH